VLFLNNQGLISIGGGPTILRHLAPALAEDFDVTVLSHDPPASDFGTVRQIAIPPPPRFRSWRIAPLLRANYLRGVVPAAEIDAADVVVAFDPHFARLLRRAKPQRLIYLSLSCVPRQEWFASRDVAGLFFSAQYAWLERGIAKAADVVIVSSATHGKELRRFECLPGLEPIVLYPVFHDTQSGLRKEPARTTILLSAGRLNPVKNYQSIIELASRLTDLDCKFVIAGDGPELEPLRQKAAAAGLSDRVVFMGSTEDMGPLLASADYFLHPSRYESFGIAIFEAMRAGVPPVCSSTAVCGIRELLTSDVDSKFVDFDKIEQAASALRTLIVDPARCKEIGMAARSASERILARDYVGEFRKVLSMLQTGIVTA
jgi:glycosyltransferase involved in cell wall biosynthesis